MASRYGNDPEMTPLMAERFTFHTLLKSIERLCGVSPGSPEATRRRRYVEMAKRTWAQNLRALDR